MIGKRFLPKSLFGRTLLILVLPVVLVQLVVAYVFFDRHWENVTRHMSRSLAGEAAFLVKELALAPGQDKSRVVRNFEQSTGIDVTFDAPEMCRPERAPHEFAEFRDQLKNSISNEFAVRRSSRGDMLEIRIALSEQCLRLATTVKRLESPTTVIFLLWMLGASVVFVVIALLFMRNQIRPIRQLAEAADRFGRGMDSPGFRPHGAAEVRKAAHAFLIMRERIKRQLRTRTEMLAGISHDLRTPLTRMKLQLAMLGYSDAVKELSDDVQQMEHMIQEYLDFARGEGREEATATNLHELLADVASDYRRQREDVSLEGGDPVTMNLRVGGMRRLLHNVIDNAVRYGKRCRLSWRIGSSWCDILVDDAGPGIPKEMREEVFKPFNRLETSRNVKTGGVGLGLTIARDIALAHGGGISLDDSPLGGLRVIIRLPL